MLYKGKNNNEKSDSGNIFHGRGADADGSLTLKVKLASEKLKNPMEYTLKYVPVK